LSENQSNLDSIREAVDRTNKELVALRQSLEKMNNEAPKGTKDRWDKAGVIAQFLSGAVIAAIGLIISYSVNSAQQDITKQIGSAQIEVSKRQQFSDYLKLITDATKDDERRATLIANLDLAVPDHAIRIAAHYAFSDNSPKVRREAIQMLGKFADGRPVLTRISGGSVLPESHLAEIALGQQVKEVRARISDIDDFGRLLVNDTVVAEVRFGNDSGWINLTSHLKPGENRIDFFLDNGPHGGWSGRLQVSAGEHQYDSTTLTKNACPCNAPVFQIRVLVVVGKDGKIDSLAAKQPVYF
jgi:hypothetical protein